MRASTLTALLAAALVTGVAGSHATAQTPAPPAAAADSAAAPREPLALPAVPLILDRTDLRIGVTVEFNRLPTAAEANDLQQTPGLAHVVVMLPAWPGDLEPLLVLAQLPPEADCIVILPGYPPTRAAAEAWNMVQARLRIVVVAQGPPPSPAVVQDLNGLRALERVIADVDYPSRAGFERLQRPLSFRMVVP